MPRVNVHCGFEAKCGRPFGHRGHHGGWRTDLQIVAENPVIREHEDQLGSVLTQQNLRAAAEMLAHGDSLAAAECMGIAQMTLRNHVSSALAKTGATSYGHLGVVLGWTKFPEGLGHSDE
jgi:DNA-binding CsgD family transcriptional regulator